MSVRCSLGLLVLTMIPLIVGCEEEEVAWMPDSAGLMFRDDTKGWSRYDLKKNSTEQVVKATTQGLQGVAVSPRGDQFAVGTATGKHQQLSLQITIYSRVGDVLQQSIRYDIGQSDFDPARVEVRLEWSTSGRIAVFAETGTGIYDPRTAKLLWLKDYSPYLEASYVGSNLVPDGSGLILEKVVRDAPVDPDPATLPDVVLADWEGRIVRTTRLPPTPPVLRKLLNNREQPICRADYAVWNFATCRLQIHDYRLDFNPRTGTAAWFHNPLQLDKHIPGLDADSNYALLPVGAGGWYVYYRFKEMSTSLEMINVKTKAHQVLAKDIEVDGAVLSPDRSKLAITFSERKPGTETWHQTTIIVNETGKVIARLSRGEYQPPAAPPAPLVAPAAPGEGEAPAAPIADSEAPPQ